RHSKDTMEKGMSKHKIEAANKLKRRLGIKPVSNGCERQWVKCNECGRVAHYEYVPFSLSQAVLTLPCGHGAALKWSKAVTYLEEHAALMDLAASKLKESVFETYS